MAVAPPFDPDLFDLLVCPVSRKPLKWAEGRLVSTDAETRLAYRVEGDVPVMLADAATALEPGEWQRLMALDGPIGQGADAVRRRHGRA